jgi:hypothetical protein
MQSEYPLPWLPESFSLSLSSPGVSQGYKKRTGLQSNPGAIRLFLSRKETVTCFSLPAHGKTSEKYNDGPKQQFFRLFFCQSGFLLLSEIP